MSSEWFDIKVYFDSAESCGLVDGCFQKAIAADWEKGFSYFNVLPKTSFDEDDEVEWDVEQYTREPKKLSLYIQAPSLADEDRINIFKHLGKVMQCSAIVDRENDQVGDRKKFGLLNGKVVSVKKVMSTIDLGLDDLLGVAIEQKKFKQVQELLQKGANPRTKVQGMEALVFAASENSTKIVKELLRYKVDLAAVDKQMRTALHWAANDCNNSMAKALIAAGADINAQDEEGETSLHGAIYSRKELSTIKLLLDAGADVNLCNSSGHSSLMVMFSVREPEEDFELFQLLLKHKGDLNQFDSDGGNICWHAATSPLCQAWLKENGFELKRPETAYIGEEKYDLRTAIYHDDREMFSKLITQIDTLSWETTKEVFEAAVHNSRPDYLGPLVDKCSEIRWHELINFTKLMCSGEMQDYVVALGGEQLAEEEGQIAECLDRHKGYLTTVAEADKVEILDDYWGPEKGHEETKRVRLDLLKFYSNPKDVQYETESEGSSIIVCTRFTRGGISLITKWAKCDGEWKIVSEKRE